jgi:hypothetical protein
MARVLIVVILAAACGGRGSSPAPEQASAPCTSPAAWDGGPPSPSSGFWTRLPPVGQRILAFVIDASGAPAVAVAQSNGRNYLWTNYGVTGTRPGSAARVLRFDGTSWTPLGGLLEGEADQMLTSDVRLFTDAGGSLFAAWDEQDGIQLDRSEVFVRRWDGLGWQPVGARVSRSGFATMRTARADAAGIWLVYDWVVLRSGPDPLEEGAVLARWDGTQWSSSSILEDHDGTLDRGLTAWAGFICPTHPLLREGDMLWTSPIRATRDGALLRVTTDNDGATSTLWGWSGAWTPLDTVDGASLLPPSGAALSPDLALDSSGGAAVSWLAVTTGAVTSQIPHTAVIARWRLGALQVIGSFPATGFLSSTDKASLAFDSQNNLYVAVADGDSLTGSTNIYRYAK